MTITIQENTDISLKNDIKKITQIQNVPASLSGQDSSKKAKLPYKGDYVEKVLSDIILSSKGKPDRLAIMLYSFLKSWFKPNSNRKFNKSGKFDIRKYGYRTSYEQLAKEFKCSEESIRQKIVLLEKFGLLNRNFRIEYEGGVRKNNVLYLLLWKDTPYFEFEHGLEKRQLFKPSINKEKWKEIAKNETGGSPKILGEGLQAKLDTPPQPALDTNILRVNNLYNVSIERLFTVYNNNTHARGFDSKTCVNDFADKNNDINKPVHTNSAEIKTLNTEKTSYADFAFGSLAKPTQSAVDEWEENETEELAALLDNDCLNDPVVPIDPEEIVANEQATRRMLLSKALWSTLGEQRSGEIQDDYKFVETELHKVCIQTKAMLLNDIEKAKIRKAIQSVYGQDVTIAMQIIASLQNEPIPSDKAVELEHSVSKPNWLNFKSVIKNHSLFAALNNPSLTIDESPEKIVIEGVAFLIERIIEPGSLEELENAVLETGLTLELKVDNNHSECKDNPQKVVVLAPEEIIKKIKLAWYKKQEERRKYEIFKSRHGIV